MLTSTIDYLLNTQDCFLICITQNNCDTCLVPSQKPVLPPTVSDQIQLWELERDRFKFTDGVLYNQFLSQSDFELLHDYARVSLV